MKMSSIIFLKLICQLLVTISFHNLAFATAQVACITTLDCERLYQSGSICGDDGFCKNPYIGGCLRDALGEEVVPRRRACNSHDTPDIIEKGLCEPSPFDYMEIQISPGNWESAMFYAYLIQVILSELLFVPASINIDADAKTELNFYDPNNGFPYHKISHNYKALETSNRYGDCQKTNENCAHVIPEWWRAYQVHKMNYSEVEEVINSMIGYVSWFLPTHVVEENLSLGSYHGYFGEKNRKKLAETFKRPTTWGDYCAKVSNNNCTQADDFASGPPNGADEAATYFFESESRKYNGFFRATDKNNCTKNPDTCTGHFIDYPCSWGAWTDQQLYWNNISLEKEVYNYGEMQQIFKAANATKSAIIHTWFYPDSLVEQYDYRKIQLPEATRECQDHRFQPEPNRCSANKSDLIGDKRGSCGYQVQTLGTLIANSVKKNSLESPSEELRSPAYETLRNIQINDLDVSDMLADWVKTKTKESTGYHARKAVCSWLAKSYNSTDKAQSIRRFIPPTFPREFSSIMWNFEWYNFAATIFGGFVIVIVILTYAATRYYKNAKTIKLAQREFLDLCSLGYFMVCIAAILCATMPTDASCSAIQWLISIGYTQGMVPLLIKVSAINRLMQQANRMRRVRITKNRLYWIVLASTLFIGTYLLVWTLIDPILQTKELTLTSEEDKNIVNVNLYCASSSKIWICFAFLWEAVHMLASAILSFQSRNVRAEMNESRELARMAYVHLIFFIVRLMVFFLLQTKAEIATSFLLSMDSLLSIILYFGPKLLAARRQDNLSLPDINPLSNIRRHITSATNRERTPSNSQAQKQSSDGSVTSEQPVSKAAVDPEATEISTQFSSFSSITSSLRSTVASSVTSSSRSNMASSSKSVTRSNKRIPVRDSMRNPNEASAVDTLQEHAAVIGCTASSSGNEISDKEKDGMKHAGELLPTVEEFSSEHSSPKFRCRASNTSDQA